jgi:hypothetical protein
VNLPREFGPDLAKTIAVAVLVAVVAAAVLTMVAFGAFHIIQNMARDLWGPSN